MLFDGSTAYRHALLLPSLLSQGALSWEGVLPGDSAAARIDALPKAPESIHHAQCPVTNRALTAPAKLKSLSSWLRVALAD